MKVTGWTDWENNEYTDIGNASFEDWKEATQTVIDDIKSHGYKINGSSHQNGYAPIIDNKWLYAISMRSWGAIMQKAYDLPDEDGLGYVLWAWGTPTDEEEVLPERN